MSLNIVSRTIGGELDKKFVLLNHQAGRLMSIQDNWTRLRIGCRFAVDDTGASLAGTPRMYFGLLASPAAGLTNGPLSVGTSHFVGIRSTSATWSRVNVPPANYQSAFSAVTKVGTTVGSVAFGSSLFFTGDAAARRYGLIVEFLKGSPNWTVDVVGFSNSTTGSDVDYDTFVQAMEAETAADAEAILDTEGAYSRQQITTLPVDEATNGDLIAVCMAWDRSSIDLEWSELLFAKFA